MSNIVVGSKIKFKLSKVQFCENWLCSLIKTLYPGKVKLNKIKNLIKTLCSQDPEVAVKDRNKGCKWLCIGAA